MRERSGWCCVCVLVICAHAVLVWSSMARKDIGIKAQDARLNCIGHGW